MLNIGKTRDYGIKIDSSLARPSKHLLLQHHYRSHCSRACGAGICRSGHSRQFSSRSKRIRHDQIFYTASHKNPYSKIGLIFFHYLKLERN